MNHDRIRLFFGGQAMAAGIFLPPVLADGFSGIVQPIAIREEGDRFDGCRQKMSTSPKPIKLMKTFTAFICTWFAAIAMLADPNSGSMQQARKVANNEGKAQQAIEPSSPPTPTPPAQNNPPPDPALEATLRNIAGLQADFETLNSNPTNKQPLINDLTAAAQGTKASPKSVAKLADDLAAAISGKQKLHAQHQKLAQYIHAIFNSSHLAPAQQQMVIDRVELILYDGEVSADDTAKVLADIKTIAAETK